MKISIEQLAAIFKIGSIMIMADDKMQQEEVDFLFNFLENLNGYSEEIWDEIAQMSSERLSFEDATAIVANLDADTKQNLSNVLAEIVCCNGEATPEEAEVFVAIQEQCQLPDPEVRNDEQDDEPDDAIIPAYIIAKSNGIAQLFQTESTGYPTLDNELAAQIGVERLEVVRYTAPLNALSQHIGLSDQHLVFLADRNGYANPDAGDNMTGTILYGTGHEIMGDIIFALETDSGYKIMGIPTQSMLNNIYNTINKAVGGLLRIQ